MLRKYDRCVKVLNENQVSTMSVALAEGASSKQWVAGDTYMSGRRREKETELCETVLLMCAPRRDPSLSPFGLAEFSTNHLSRISE